MKMNEAELSENDTSDEDDWKEEDTEENVVKCLFCESIFSSVESALTHCKDSHSINFKTLMETFRMDCYSFIKLINYVRITLISAKYILKLDQPLWNDDVYLKPVQENDPWLMFDFEDYFSSFNDNESRIDQSVPTSENLLSQLELQLQHKDEQLSYLTEQLSQMKNVAHKIVLDTEAQPGHEEGNLTNSYDSNYFESYSHHGIHCDMLLDDVRTSSYRNAILKNASIFFNKTVLDLGCGTGILSMFAASAGAETVYAVDNSDVIYNAIDIIRENNLQHKVEIIKSRIENKNLPFDKVDIIISEWMGYFLLFEGMLDSVIYARDNFLKPGGVILPAKCHMYICGAHDLDRYKKFVSFWDNVYGYRMSCIQNEILKEATVDVIPADCVVTSTDLISTFDLYNCTVDDTNFESCFKITSEKNTCITLFVGYFDVVFRDENCVCFSTSPSSVPTHWKQTLFYLRDPIQLLKGEILTGKLVCRRSNENKRSLIVTIEVPNQSLRYHLR